MTAKTPRQPNLVGGRLGCGGADTLEGRSIVLLGTDLSTGGGVNRVIRDLSQIFAEDLRLATTVVSARSRASPSYSFPSSVNVERPTDPPAGLLGYFRYLLALRRRRFDFAVGFWTQDNLLLLAALLLSGTRVIVSEHISHGFAPKHISTVRRLLYPFAYRVTVLNRSDHEYYRRWLPQTILVPNPVSIDWAFGCGTDRERLILAIGHLIPLKGFDDLVEAFARSGLAQTGWRLVIIGEGPEEDRLYSAASKLPPASFDIRPPTANLDQWYRRAKIIAVPSRVEAFSLVLVEAIAAGVVPIAYRVPGPAFILEEAPGQLVDPGDVGGLADGLTRAAANPHVSELQQHLKASVARRMSRSVVGQIWRDLLTGRAVEGA